MQDRIRNTYVVGEEDTVVFVLVDGVHPRVADEMDMLLVRDALQGYGLEVERRVVVVLDDDGSGDALTLVPAEVHVELGLAGGHRRHRRDPFLQVCRWAYLPLVSIVCSIIIIYI